MIDTEPLTLGRACKRLGWSGKRPARRLLGHIRARERALEITILTSRIGPGGKPRMFVTMRMLRKHFPHWFALSTKELRSAFDAAESKIRKQMIARLEQLKDEDREIVNAKLQMLRADAIETNKTVRLLIEKVDGLARKIGQNKPL